MPPKPDKAEKNAARMTQFRAERNSAAAEIVRIKSWVDESFGEDIARPSDFLIRKKYEALEERYQVCRNAQRQLELLDSQEIGADFWLTTDEAYLTASEILEPLVPPHEEPRRSPPPHAESSRQEAPLIRMPPIELDTFSGEDSTKWLSFWDKFRNLVHLKNFDPVYKFDLLSRHLTGKASNQIADLEMTSDNYEEAVRMLMDRWHNKKLLSYAHLDKIFCIKKLQKSDPGDLLALVDAIRSNVRALSHIGREVDGYGDILSYWVLNRLDKDTRERWDDFCDLTDVPPLNLVLEFIEHRAGTLRTSAQEEPKQSSKKPQRGGNVLVGTESKTDNKAGQGRSCPICDQKNHFIYTCQRFKALSVPDRRARARSLSLCFRCLGVGHYLRDCKSGTCRKCGDAHHTLLCQPKNQSDSANSASDPAGSAGPQNSLNSGAVLHSSTRPDRSSNYNLLATAVVLVRDKDGEWIPARAVLDSGSQFNFVTEDLRQRLRLPKRRESVQVHTISGGYQNLFATSLQMKSRFNEYSVTLESLVQRRITGNLPSRVLQQFLKIPANIQLADPNYHQPGRVDLLLSVEVTAEILRIGCIHLGPGQPTLQNTLLGWIISGRLNGPQLEEGTCAMAVSDEPQNEPEFDMRRFWEVECVEEENETQLTPAEQRVESYFASTVKRREDGSYEVRLPFKERQVELGDSKGSALRRLQAIERRLDRDSYLKTLYFDFMDEYLSRGHMVEVPPDQVDKIRYFIPHHFVLRPESSTTKLRVVFDASAKTSSGFSLNDNLEKGPRLQQDLFDILIRFRTYFVAICGDIEKMFRQIYVFDGESYFQGIVWNGKVYRLVTVTYGTTSAPYLAVRALIQCCEDQECNFPVAAAAARRDCFMDDLLSGARSEEEAKILRQQMSAMLSTCGMRIRKWISNSPAVMEEIPEEDRATCTVIDEGDFVKTLGIIFFPNEDIFSVKVEIDTERKISKRTIQSDVARVFDPLGLVQPVVVVMKMLLQELWALHLGWDESPPQHVYSVYERLREQLSQISAFHVPRWVMGQQAAERLELHAFGDASEKAYGAVVYVRSVSAQGVTVRLLCSKSRVAPLKKQSLARLELLAAELATKLVTRLRKHMAVDFDAIYCWADNTTVLHWLKKESRLFHTFVANRVSKIQSADFITEWRHVPTTANPADMVSRGLSPAEFMTPEVQQFWLHGPKFLEEGEANWPPRLPGGEDQELPEMRGNRSAGAAGAVLAATVPLPDLVERIDGRFHHSAASIGRIFSYVHRFIAICRRQVVPVVAPGSELESILGGLVLALRAIQATHFATELRLIISGQKKRLRGPLRFLDPYLDETDGLLHAGGRLGRGSHVSKSKTPVIIPAFHFLARALMRFFHFRNQHCGPRALLAEVRMAGFWIINGKRLATTVVRNCVICFCCNPKTIQPKMGNLPKETITPGIRAFINVAVDFAAGLMVHQEGRGRRPTKAYACVFVCMASRAVHLELVTRLTTDAFIAAIRRFIGRRGLCKKIFCDNATNFAGCDAEMARLCERLLAQEVELNQKLLEDRIQFQFSPANSPHFNGLAEAAVKSLKFHLRRIVGMASLNYEEMSTILVQVEAALNSRPLQALTEDPNDLEALTPAHILIGEPLKSFLEPIEDSDADLTTRYRRLRALFQHFWNRWQNEVLQDRQTRYRWKEDGPNLRVGQLVLVTDDKTRPYTWPLARIVATHPGSDGIVRVVSVRTKSDTLRRAANRVCPLPVEAKSPVYPIGRPNLVDQTRSGQGGRDVQ